MTAGGRLAVAGGCIAIGVFVAWAMHSTERIEASGARLRAPLPAADAAEATSSVLWVLAIGVSRYQDASLNLQFADSDARAVVAALQRQSDGPLYREAKTLLLTNEEVTREAILGSMEGFLGQAGLDDVAVIFVAGHGVQDRASGSYYFLPFPATGANLLTDGLRMSDFDEMVRVVRHNVRGVVVMLDTCHAGALRVSSSTFVPTDDAGARLSAGEGFFLLAATKPGEDSKEQSELGHGAFTYALIEGLGGAADSDGDGWLSVSDLFGYVAREVPRLTGGMQHPYHKVEGTDLVLAAVRRDVTAPRAPLQQTAQPPARTAANTIGVMEFRDLRAEPEHEWIGEAVRVALNTELSKVRALRVYSPQLIDRTAATRKSDQLTTAQRLGIRKLLTGSFHVVGHTIRIDAEIVDSATGLQEGSDSVQGDLDDFFALQKKLVLSMLRRLRVDVSADEGASIQTKSNTNVDAYRLLLEAEGVLEQPGASRPTAQPQPSPEPPQSRWGDGLQRFAAAWLRPADAEETGSGAETEVHQVLEEYRRALEDKNLDRLAALYVSFPAPQRAALRAYLESATDLSVELSDITIESRDREVAVSYTRRDRFVDKESAKPQRVEVRLTKILVREQGTWKITGGR